MTDDDTSDSELNDAVEDALEPARHEAVMAVWQQVVLARLEHPEPTNDIEDLLRRYREEGPPEDPR